MPLLTERRVIAKSQQVTGPLRKSAARVLAESATTRADAFDIFLSHSAEDAPVVLGTRAELETKGYTVYVDWVDDPQLSRSDVTLETARALRRRMRQCKALFYLRSLSSATSKWMPWELGFFDGLNGRVAILPISKTERWTYTGVEYLGIYPYVDVCNDNRGTERFWINRAADRYAALDAWIDDPSSIRLH